MSQRDAQKLMIVDKQSMVLGKEILSLKSQKLVATQLPQ
jgi:hypothetical protein